VGVDWRSPKEKAFDSAADVIRGLRDALEDAGNAFCTWETQGEAITAADTWLSQHTETIEENVSG
jgi:hypothetical protein